MTRKLKENRQRKVVGMHTARLFIDEENGLTLYDRWLLKVLEYYRSYAEVNNILLSADGQPVLDSFGLPREAPYEPGMNAPVDRVKKGAVWMTRDTFRTAWESVVGSGYYKDDPRYAAIYAARKSQAHDPAKASSGYTHPMNNVFYQMVRDGRVIRKGGNRFMVSEAECKRLGREADWKLHLDRGWRWERLTYVREEEQPSLTGKHAKNIADDAVQFMTVKKRAVSGRDESLRHQNEAGWRDVLERASHYLLVDFETIRQIVNEVAEETGLISTVEKGSGGEATVRTHISKWLKQKKLVKVLSRFYQHSELNPRTLTRGHAPLLHNLTWKERFLILQADKAMTDPQSVFTLNDLIDFYGKEGGETTSKTYQLCYNTVKSFIENEVVVRASLHDFAMNPIRTHLFVAAFGDKYPDMLSMHEMVEQILVAHLPLEVAIDQLNDSSSSDAIWTVVNRLNQVEDDIQFSAYLLRLVRKMGWSPRETREYLSSLFEAFGTLHDTANFMNKFKGAL